MNIILLLTSIQAFFLSAVLFSKKNKHLSDIILGIWLTLIGFHMFIYFSHSSNLIKSDLLINLNAGFPFLQGPFLYFYVDTLTKQKSKLSPLYFFHLIPCLLFLGYQYFILKSYNFSSHNLKVTSHIFEQNVFFNLILLASVPVYVSWSLFLLKNYQTRLLNTLSAIDKINLNWLRNLITGLGFIWLIVIIVFVILKYFGMEQARNVSNLIFIAVTIFVYVIGYLGFKQTTIFSDIVGIIATKNGDDNNYNKNSAIEEVKSKKYQKSGLNKELAEKISQELNRYMQNEKPYLNENLTLPQVAEDLGISINNLSQIINDKFIQNFYYYINSYRVEEIKTKMLNSENDIYSLTALAYECGFGSKSSFNRIFKKITGQTPTQYKKSMKNKS